VEKVVYAPRKPVTAPTVRQFGSWKRSTRRPTTAPARKHPLTLIVKVLSGNTLAVWRSTRRSAP
jgi:hypothetical protein